MASFTILNWNIGGAKYLELPSKRHKDMVTIDPEKKFNFREEYHASLNAAIQYVFEEYPPHPDVICLQEIVQYEEQGNADLRKDIIDHIEGYTYIPCPLIDTKQFGAKAKWDKVRELGKWNENAFFSQGNGFLVSEHCQVYPMLSLHSGLMKSSSENRSSQHCSSTDHNNISIERVDLFSGLYFGNRNSEPRAAFVLHIVRPAKPEEGQNHPLDIFIVNLHLTTLKGERVGIPDTDEKGSQIRLNQLQVVLDNCISLYNEWSNNKYRFSDGKSPVLSDFDTVERLNPVWILVGDFNFTPQSAEYQYLTRRNFVDLFHQEPTKSSGLGEEPTITVDYMFAGPLHYSIKGRLENKDTEKNDVFSRNNSVKVSDHYPMHASVAHLFLTDRAK